MSPRKDSYWPRAKGVPHGRCFTWNTRDRTDGSLYPIHIHSMKHDHLANTINLCQRRTAKELLGEAPVFSDNRTVAGVHFPVPPLIAVLKLYPTFIYLLDEQALRKTNTKYAQSSERAYVARMRREESKDADTWTEEERELYASRRPKRIPRYCASSVAPRE